MNTLVKIIFGTVAAFSVAIPSHSQRIPDFVAKLNLNSTCSPIGYFKSHPDKPPIVFGEPFVIPKLRVKFVDKATGTPVNGRYIVVHYQWQYFNPTVTPGAEFCSRGCWRDAYENAQCITDDDGSVVLPEVTLVPSGWFKSKPKLFFSTAPRFEEVAIAIHAEHWIFSNHLSRKELKKIREKGQSGVTYAVDVNLPSWREKLKKTNPASDPH